MRSIQMGVRKTLFLVATFLTASAPAMAKDTPQPITVEELFIQTYDIKDDNGMFYQSMYNCPDVVCVKLDPRYPKGRVFWVQDAKEDTSVENKRLDQTLKRLRRYTGNFVVPVEGTSKTIDNQIKEALKIVKDMENGDLCQRMKKLADIDCIVFVFAYVNDDEDALDTYYKKKNPQEYYKYKLGATFLVTNLEKYNRLTKEHVCEILPFDMAKQIDYCPNADKLVLN